MRHTHVETPDEALRRWSVTPRKPTRATPDPCGPADMAARTLKRLGGGVYETSDGRYRLEPYNDDTEVTRGRGPRRWYVIDTTNAELPRIGYTITRFRREFCSSAQ